MPLCLQGSCACCKHLFCKKCGISIFEVLQLRHWYQEMCVGGSGEGSGGGGNGEGTTLDGGEGVGGGGSGEGVFVGR